MLQDLIQWWARLQKGGLLAGHDFVHRRMSIAAIRASRKKQIGRGYATESTPSDAGFRVENSESESESESENCRGWFHKFKSKSVIRIYYSN